MDIILIPGLWLPSSIWADVIAELGALGHRASAVALPGVDDSDATADLGDQLSAVLAAVDAADRPLVVGHSAASTLAWMAADRRPESVAGVALVGGMPTTGGQAYATFFPIDNGVMAFPGWEPFEGPDIADLDDTARAGLDAISVPVAAGVAEGVVEYFDERRMLVPVAMVCPEYSPEDARKWLDEGHIPELKDVERLSLVDIDSGHWPMTSCPAELAKVLDGIARGL